MALFSEEEINKANEKTRVVKKEQTIKYDTHDMSGKDGQVRMIIDGEPRWVDPVGPEKISVSNVETKPENGAIVSINETGVMGFANQLELSTAAKFAIQVKLAPEHLRKEGLEAVAAAMMMCKQHSLPLSAMAQMAYIRGKIECYGSLVTALAERHPEYGEMKVFFLDSEQNEICMKNKNLNADVWACVVQTRKKNHKSWNEFFFTKTEAEKAGLLGNASQTYKKYLKDMLWHRAKSRAFDFNYASALEGIHYHEALVEIEPPKEVGPSLSEKLELMKNEQG